MYDDPAWANNATRRFAETGKSKFGGLNSARADLLLRLLDRIRSPDEIGPLRSLALHRLKGARNGQWAMTVNGPWRICFHFEETEMHMRSKSSTTIKRLKPVHPGELLVLEMEARGLSSLALSLKLRVPANRISEIVKGRRGITPETALRIGRYFGTGAELWTRLQSDYDLAMAERELGPTIRREVDAA